MEFGNEQKVKEQLIVQKNLGKALTNLGNPEKADAAINEIKALLNTKKISLNSTRAYFNLFYRAISAEHYEFAHFLLDLGADPTITLFPFNNSSLGIFEKSLDLAPDIDKPKLLRKIYFTKNAIKNYEKKHGNQ